jgi:hypothetical protein
MKSFSLNSRKIEFLLYGSVWLLVFAVTFFSSTNSFTLDRNRIIGEWVHLAAFFILFMMNVYLLVPRLFFRKKYFLYFFLSIAITLLVIGLSFIKIPGFPPHGGPPGGSMPDAFGNDRFNPLYRSPFMKFLGDFIIAILLFGAGTATKLVSKWLEEEKLRKDAEKEHLKTNLALLRHQVSPHFFMNTLNNIHSLIEIDAEKAQDAISRLSTLMRYLLYDSAQNTIELKKEIDFIKSFISLMQLRHSEEVKVSIILPEQIPDVKIPPMLFISLLENAFKHGVSYPQKSYIYFELQFTSTFLTCIIKNSKHKIAANFQGEYSGIGLDNIKESLKLLYENSFQLKILDKESEFVVDLKIPL